MLLFYHYRSLIRYILARKGDNSATGVEVNAQGEENGSALQAAS
jgi:hypothetical protein